MLRHVGKSLWWGFSHRSLTSAHSIGKVLGPRSFTCHHPVSPPSVLGVLRTPAAPGPRLYGGSSSTGRRGPAAPRSARCRGAHLQGEEQALLCAPPGSPDKWRARHRMHSTRGQWCHPCPCALPMSLTHDWQPHVGVSVEAEDRPLGGWVAGAAGGEAPQHLQCPAPTLGKGEPLRLTGRCCPWGPAGSAAPSGSPAHLGAAPCCGTGRPEAGTGGTSAPPGCGVPPPPPGWCLTWM